jgi:hypothetical protein
MFLALRQCLPQEVLCNQGKITNFPLRHSFKVPFWGWQNWTCLHVRLPPWKCCKTSCIAQFPATCVFSLLLELKVDNFPTREGVIQELLVLKNLLCTAGPADRHSSSCRPAICLGLLLVRCSSYSLRCLYSTSSSQAFIHRRQTPLLQQVPTPTKKTVSLLPKCQLSTSINNIWTGLGPASFLLISIGLHQYSSSFWTRFCQILLCLRSLQMFVQYRVVNAIQDLYSAWNNTRNIDSVLRGWNSSADPCMDGSLYGVICDVDEQQGMYNVVGLWVLRDSQTLSWQY